MARALKETLRGVAWLFIAFLLTCTGCWSTQVNVNTHGLDMVPREGPDKMTYLPEYVINPPDVLVIDAVRLVPLPPYKVEPLDALLVYVARPGFDPGDPKKDLIPTQPIAGIYRVEPDGVINLGFEYGAVNVVGKTIPEVKESIKNHLQTRFKADIEVRINLSESRALQQIRGDHLVQPDGRITLGTYGSVFVSGMTLKVAKAVIRNFLEDKIQNPEISLDVSGFNSTVYYIVFDLGAGGQSVTRMPFTGRETVLDAIADLKGLPASSDRFRMWIARPNPEDQIHEQVLPIDWQAITKKGLTATNYQVLPSDRLYIAVDPLVETDGMLAKVIAPIERVLGIVLLGNSTVLAFPRGGGSSNNNNINNGI